MTAKRRSPDRPKCEGEVYKGEDKEEEDSTYLKTKSKYEPCQNRTQIIWSPIWKLWLCPQCRATMTDKELAKKPKK